MTDIDQAALHLGELCAFAEGNRSLSRATRTWLATGLGRHMVGGEPLEAALGLASECRPRARTRLIRQRRDRALAAAWRQIEAPSPWRRSLALERQVRRFRADIWPRWKELEGPPAGVSKLRAELFSAFKIGLNVPESARQLHDIVTAK